MDYRTALQFPSRDGCSEYLPKPTINENLVTVTTLVLGMKVTQNQPHGVYVFRHLSVTQPKYQSIEWIVTTVNIIHSIKSSFRTSEKCLYIKAIHIIMMRSIAKYNKYIC